MLDTQGKQVPGFKSYVQTYVPAPLEWKIKPWFQIDLKRLLEWYSDLESNYQECKFVYGENKQVWTEQIDDPTGRTGHIMPPESFWYVLTFAGNQKGALPPIAKNVTDEYKEQWTDKELNPRYCFNGYGLDIIKQMPARVRKIQISSHAPGHQLILHQDSTDNIRFHIALKTNEHCWWEIAGERVHIPADGWVYLVNTSLPHRVYNLGDSERVHLYGKVWTEDVLNSQT